MAYNQFFPSSYQAYQPGFPYQQYQPYPQAVPQYQTGLQNQQLQQVQPNTQQTQQIQNGGFISVRSIEEAFNWPVAPGNSITFKDENAPYVYTKTKSFSQLEQPLFEKYRLVKEDNVPTDVASHGENKAEDGVDYKKQIELLWDKTNAFEGRLRALESKEESKPIKKAVSKKEATDNDT